MEFLTGTSMSDNETSVYKNVGITSKGRDDRHEHDDYDILF